MSHNSIIIIAAVAALSLPCLAPSAAAAGVAFSHVNATSASPRLLGGFISHPSPPQRPPPQKPPQFSVVRNGLPNLCRLGGCYPATIGPGVNGFAGQLPAGPRLPR